MKTVHVEVSWKSIMFLILFPLGLYFLWNIRDLIFSLLIGFILMSALKPGVDFFTKKKVPRVFAVAIVYVLFISSFIALFSVVIPPIVTESANLISNFPSIIQHLNPSIKNLINFTEISRYIPTVTNNVVDIVFGIFSNTLFVMSTLFVGLYLLIEEDILEQALHHYLDKKRADAVVAVFEKAEQRMASWFWGELTLMTAVGLLTYIGLSLLGIKYALPLAVLAGMLELVPNLGPTISAIPAVIVALTQSPFSAVSTLALYIIVQQLENNLIVPIIMKKAVGINPIITLIALVVGGRVGGILGVLLAVPAFLFIETIVTEFFMKKEVVAENAQ